MADRFATWNEVTGTATATVPGLTHATQTDPTLPVPPDNLSRLTVPLTELRDTPAGSAGWSAGGGGQVGVVVLGDSDTVFG